MCIRDRSLFADDTAAFVSEPNTSYAAIKLQRQLDAYVGWTDDWRVAVNGSKSAAVIFSRKRKRPRPLKLGPFEVPWTNSVKSVSYTHLDVYKRQL